MSLFCYQTVQDQIEKAALAAGRSPQEISLVAVTKGVPWEKASFLYQAGQRLFAENRVEEALPKKTAAPQDTLWHLIGTLQRNKARRAIGQFALIHSVDTLELARKLSLLAVELHLSCSILLQVNTSGEVNKHGLSIEQWQRSFDEAAALPGLSIKGLMTMGPFSGDRSATRRCFSALRAFRDELQSRKNEKHSLHELSMGMSRDFTLAIQEGATLLRIGSTLFR